MMRAAIYRAYWSVVRPVRNWLRRLRGRPVTGADVVAEVRRLAAEYPDAVYLNGDVGCYYAIGVVKNGPPIGGCLIGQALFRLVGPQVDEEDRLANKQCEAVGVEVRENERRWLLDVQASQDSGDTWSKAVTDADADGRVYFGVRI